MEPNSTVFVVLVFLVSAGALVALVRFKNLVVRLLAGILALATATAGGMAIVNDYYGYYQSWSQLGAELTGNYNQFTTSAIGKRGDPHLNGKIVSTVLSGAHSGISRSGFVYLPPQYFQRAYRHTHFPVVELLHGSPSYAGSWLVHLHADSVADDLISQRRMGPMVLVMPQTYSANKYTECLNSSRGANETYLTTDVRHDVESRFRVTRDPSQWALV